MRSFLGHARERKRALDENESNTARAISSAWRCLDVANVEGGGGGGGGAAAGDETSSDKENVFAILFEFVNKFNREVQRR